MLKCLIWAYTVCKYCCIKILLLVGLCVTHACTHMYARANTYVQAFDLKNTNTDIYCLFTVLVIFY